MGRVRSLRPFDPILFIMKSTVFSRSLLILSLSAFFLSSVQAAPSADEMIAKAREFLGGDERLAAVQTLQYTGDFVGADGTTATIEILLQKPLLQRITLVREDRGQRTVLGEFESWIEIFDPANPERKNIILQDDPRAVRELRATTWENLYFFSGLSQRGGRVESLGMSDMEGRSLMGLNFRHRGGVNFTRYFDPASGELVFTKSDQTRIREEGHQTVNGIRFPVKVITERNGELLHTVTFTSIKVNEPIPEEVFTFPRIRR